MSSVSEGIPASFLQCCLFSPIQNADKFSFFPLEIHCSLPFCYPDLMKLWWQSINEEDRLKLFSLLEYVNLLSLFMNTSFDVIYFFQLKYDILKILFI